MTMMLYKSILLIKLKLKLHFNNREGNLQVYNQPMKEGKGCCHQNIINLLLYLVWSTHFINIIIKDENKPWPSKSEWYIKIKMQYKLRPLFYRMTLKNKTTNNKCWKVAILRVHNLTIWFIWYSILPHIYR